MNAAQHGWRQDLHVRGSDLPSDRYRLICVVARSLGLAPQRVVVDEDAQRHQHVVGVSRLAVESKRLLGMGEAFA